MQFDGEPFNGNHGHNLRGVVAGSLSAQFLKFQNFCKPAELQNCRLQCATGGAGDAKDEGGEEQGKG